MENLRLGALVLGAILCASPAHALRPNQMPDASTQDLCREIMADRSNARMFREYGDEAKAELRSRGTFTEEEMALIETASVEIGMREEAALCSWGYFWYDLNQTSVDGAIVRQYVFGDGGYNPRQYLYTTNGVVSGIQN